MLWRVMPRSCFNASLSLWAGDVGLFLGISRFGMVFRSCHTMSIVCEYA